MTGRAGGHLHGGGRLLGRVRGFEGALLSVEVIQWNLSNTDPLGPIKCVLIREVSSFQGANNLYEVGT